MNDSRERPTPFMRKNKMKEKILKILKKHFIGLGQLDKINSLKMLFNEVQPNNYAEIGVDMGNTSYCLRKKFPNVNMYLIDAWSLDGFPKDYKKPELREHYINEFDKREALTRQKHPHSNTEIIKGLSVKTAKTFADGFFDIVFIDASHDYESCKKDIEAWLPKVRKGGILCGHDYTLGQFGVIKAVNEVIGCDNMNLMSGAVWVYRNE